MFCRKAVLSHGNEPFDSREVCEDSVEASGRVAMLIGCSVNQAESQAQTSDLSGSLLPPLNPKPKTLNPISPKPPKPLNPGRGRARARSLTDVSFFHAGRPQRLHDGAARPGAERCRETPSFSQLAPSPLSLRV